MEYRHLGKQGLCVSALALGSWMTNLHGPRLGRLLPGLGAVSDIGRQRLFAYSIICDLCTILFIFTIHGWIGSFSRMPRPKNTNPNAVKAATSSHR